MKRVHFVPIVALILSTLILAYGQLPQSGSQAGQTATRAKETSTFKAKEVLVKKLPKELEGVVVQNGIFKLKPGYKFVNQTRNTVAVALKASGHITGTFLCGCVVPAGSGKTPSGDCKAVLSHADNTISCQKDTNPCSDLCLMQAKADRRTFRLAIY